MSTLFNIIVVIQVLSALVIIALVLLQHGKGADMGAAFGSGASGSLFGATGSSNFMSKSTAVAAAVFFASTLGLVYATNNRTSTVDAGVMGRAVTAPAKPAAPANPNAIPATTVPVTAPAPAAPAPVTDIPK
ncbi:preprotein translocase subunit SecG [Massilia sp. S19_KUP03_FR1]|uniref:preprotein translocase subunit SecG n=1 Tax=Massilia sp. S19_KUP03_FR1 TaxID=3025503 RepID=UPI002FCDD383